MGNIESVIFDLDGVLVDSMPYHVKAYKRALEERGIEASSKEIYRLEGEDATLVISDFLERENVEFKESDIQEIVKNKRKIFEEIEETKVFPGMDELLRDLRMKYKLGLVSGSNRENVIGLVKEHFKDIFDCVISAEDVEKEKPHPDPYLQCLEHLRLNKGEAVIIENAPLGVKAAKNAGIKCAAVATYLPKEELKEANFVFENHDELKKWMGNNFL